MPNRPIEVRFAVLVLRIAVVVIDVVVVQAFPDELGDVVIDVGSIERPCVGWADRNPGTSLDPMSHPWTRHGDGITRPWAEMATEWLFSLQ